MSIKICLAGATGWAGSSLAAGVCKADDMELVGAVSRSQAGQSLGDVLNIADFTLPEQKLIIRHEAGASAQPYVDGALLAIRKVGTFTGLKRGLDSVMEFI